MIRLPTTAHKLQAVLAGAITTNQLHVVASFADKTTSDYAGGTKLSLTNGVSAVDIVDAPIASTIRDIDYVGVYNADTVAATVTIQEFDGVNTRTLATATLNPGDQLIYVHGSGWQALNNEGQLKGFGEKGDQGSQGSQGPQGPQGPQGDPGAPGSSLATPGGRLTLTSGAPVLTSDVAGATTVFYTPYIHDGIMLYDGSVWANHAFTELSQALSDATKSPAATVADTNYDMFVWDDASTIRCTRGPAWTNNTTRSAGTALTRLNGRLVNNVAITNGPLANRGRYVGTIRTNAANQVAWLLGGIAAGGSPQFFGLANVFNQVPVHGYSRDSTNSWAYASATIRPANNSTAQRVSFLCPLGDEAVEVDYAGWVENTSGSNDVIVGLGLDLTSSYVSRGSTAGILDQNDMGCQSMAKYQDFPGIGFHFIQALESSPDASGDEVFYGDAGSPHWNSGLHSRLFL